ncbi:peptidase U32 family protein [Treponema sp.]
MKAIELLAPAGSPEALDAAIGEGADAVYLGLKNFNARLRTTNFAYSQFEGATKLLHKQHKKIYVTVNTVFEQREADRMYQFLKYLAGVGPDGIIVQDFGVARMVRECFPALKLHASTQMNVASAKGANMLSRHGFSRVVLARELDLEEVRSVGENTSTELEVFVHGALCVSASGLCLYSSFLGGKSANRGMCTQACRRRYNIGKSGTEDGPSRDVFDFGDSSKDMPVDDGASGYFFSPSDLQLIEKVPALADLGVASLKIEGRMKSAEYVGGVVAAYRHVLDGLDGDREQAIAEAKAILSNDFARSKTSFYYDAAKPSAWLDPRQAGGTGISLGLILKVRGNAEDRQGFVRGEGTLPALGDTARFHKANDSDRKSLKLTVVEVESRGGMWISIPYGFDLGDAVYLIQTKAMSKRYASVIPRDLAGFRRMPGHEAAPELVLARAEKAEKDLFPDGLYVAVSRLEDLYVLQAVRPIRVLLSYTRAVAKRLLSDEGTPLPFSKGELILVLDPYFPQAEDERLSAEIPELLDAGYRQFMINNLGHQALFRGSPAKLIAGPYLYTFNSWAYDFVNKLGTSLVVTPLENGRQNLERTVDRDRRPLTFVTAFAYPALFRIRANLASMYDFSDFSDGRGENFKLINEPDGSLVIPEQPFSIVDKLPFLKESGFSKFILDFSGPPLKKRDYKDVMDAAKEGIPLSNTRRFNWKDGFFTPTEGKGSSGMGRGVRKDRDFESYSGGKKPHPRS